MSNTTNSVTNSTMWKLNERTNRYESTVSREILLERAKEVKDITTRNMRINAIESSIIRTTDSVELRFKPTFIPKRGIAIFTSNEEYVEYFGQNYYPILMPRETCILQLFDKIGAIAELMNAQFIEVVYPEDEIFVMPKGHLQATRTNNKKWVVGNKEIVPPAKDVYMLSFEFCGERQTAALEETKHPVPKLYRARMGHYFYVYGDSPKDIMDYIDYVY